LHNAANATSVKVRFGYLDAGNDWWWAIDNVKITGARTDPAQETIQIVSQHSQGSVSVDANGAVIYFKKKASCDISQLQNDGGRLDLHAVERLEHGVERVAPLARKIHLPRQQLAQRRLQRI